MTPRARFAVGTTIALCAIFAVKWPTLHDAHFWDALGCYVHQGRFIATHGFDLGAYRELGFVRPPLFTSLLALVMRLYGPSREALHLCSFLVGATLPPLTFALGRRLGASTAAAWLGALLCGLAPLFVAQVGLVQSDLPATALTTAAWLLLLDGRTRSFAVVASLAALTKESAWFLCAPAALLLYLRALPPSGRPWPIDRAALWRARPAALPAVVLLAWEIVHRVVIGQVLHSTYRAAIGPNHLDAALLHEFVEGGRGWLTLAATIAVIRSRSTDRAALVATAFAVAWLPLAFPAPLPRYMLSGLPLLCALAGPGLDLLAPRRRLLAGALLAAALIAGWWGAGWHSHGGHHLDANLAYRDLLKTQLEAISALGAARPQSVIATFPIFTAITAPPEDGYLDAPLLAHLPTGDDSLGQLCRSDYLVDAAQGNPLSPAIDRLRAANALVPWRRFGHGEQWIQIYSVACPAR